ncbi:histidine kinase [Clostridium estertheticum]|uniref:histidine kinase n=1 Tax=Clostridium estertheticum TaxID=238834 RepID=UPI001C0C2B77|nr:histidine kinase [Clostridium estertheticum]MBU3176058.1 histidine kinase [Clostridium estertheticum]
MDILLTKKDLATKWQVSEKAIDDYRNKGIITSVKGLPSVRFTSQHIAEIEGTKLERFSPIERKRLERENEELRIRLERAEVTIAKIQMLSTGHVYDLQKNIG